jgi:outer membrane receptor for ferrienterochelin and colicins
MKTEFLLPEKTSPLAFATPKMKTDSIPAAPQKTTGWRWNAFHGHPVPQASFPSKLRRFVSDKRSVARRVQNRRLSCFATMLGVLAGPAWAAAGAPQADQDLMSMKIEDLSRVKVYSASRHPEEAWKAPSSVSIITADEIRRYGWRTLAEALRSLCGFYISDNRQYTYLGVRGFLRPGDDNPRILLMVNGHRLNDKVYDTAAIGTEFPLDLDLIDHIEVVRGPGSSLYGTNAIFGVINVITREPGREAAAETSDDAGSLLSRSGRVTLTGSRGSVSGLLSGSMERSAGESSLYFPVFDTPETNNGWAENGDGDHFEHAWGELQAGGLHLEGMLADRIRHFPTGADGAVFNDPANQNNDARGYLDAGLHREAGQTDVDVRAYYDAYNYVGSGDYGGPGVAAPTAAYVKARANWVGTEATVTRQIGAQRITAGGDYEYALEIKQWTYAAGQPEIFWSNETPWLGGIFAEAELSLIPKVTLHAGGRVDWFSDFVDAVSPRGALIYSPGERTTLKYIVGQAYRDPNAYEQDYADGVTVATGPRKLVPEQILSHEVAAERSLRPWLTLTADGFYNRLKQLIDQVPDGDTTLSYFVNDDHVHSEGLEVEVDAAGRSGAAARASYTATTATDDVAHVPLSNSPHSQAKFNGSLPTGRRGEASLELVYVSAMTDERDKRVPTYFLPSVTYATRPLWGGWQFSSTCYDALNRRWYSPGGPNDPEDQIRMDGRGWRFKVTYRVPAHGGGRDH